MLGESWRAWVALAVGVLAVSAHSASSLTVSVLMKSIVGEFGWSRTEFATAMTARLIAITATMPLAGVLADRLGARAVLAAGAGLVGFGLLAMTRIESWWQLVAVNLVMGPGQACIGSVAASALVLRLFERHRGVAIGVLNGGDNLLNSAVPIVAVALLADGGWRATLEALAFAYLALGALITIVLYRDEGRSRVRHPLFTDLPWRDARWWVVVGAFAAIYAWVASLQLHFHAYLTDGGRSAEVASRLLSIQVLVGAAGAPLFGWLAERTSARRALAWSVAGLTVSAWLVWTLTGVGALTAWAVLHGLVNGGVVALLALVLHELFGPARIGQLLGTAMLFCMSATLLGNQWSAWVFDTTGSYVRAWQGYTLLMLLTLPPVVWLSRASR